MAKRRKTNFRWNPSHTWEVNIEELLAARRAGSEWPAAKRARQSRKQIARHKRQKRAARIKRWHKFWINRPRRFTGLRVPTGARRFDKILRVMAPGEWYALADIRVLTGLPRPQDPLIRGGEEKGPIERARGGAGDVHGYNGQPILLYRLSLTGELARALAVMLE